MRSGAALAEEAVAAEGAAEEAPNPKPNLYPRPFFGISFSSHVLYCVELT